MISALNIKKKIKNKKKLCFCLIFSHFILYIPVTIKNDNDMMNFEKKAETMHEVMSSIKSSRTENDILATIKDEFDCIYSADGLRLIKMNNSKIKSKYN